MMEYGYCLHPDCDEVFTYEDRGHEVDAHIDAHHGLVIIGFKTPMYAYFAWNQDSAMHHFEKLSFAEQFETDYRPYKM